MRRLGAFALSAARDDAGQRRQLTGHLRDARAGGGSEGGSGSSRKRRVFLPVAEALKNRLRSVRRRALELAWRYGMCRNSVATTALSLHRPSIHASQSRVRSQSGVALRFPPHSTMLVRPPRASELPPGFGVRPPLRRFPSPQTTAKDSSLFLKDSGCGYEFVPVQINHHR